MWNPWTLVERVSRLKAEWLADTPEHFRAASMLTSGIISPVARTRPILKNTSFLSFVQIAKSWTSRAKEFFKDSVLCQELDVELLNVDQMGALTVQITVE